MYVTENKHCTLYSTSQYMHQYMYVQTLHTVQKELEYVLILVIHHLHCSNSQHEP